jgi:phospholipid-binding lipoprotein MlaA
MKRTIALTLLLFCIVAVGCATAPVKEEPIVPAKRTLDNVSTPEKEQAFYVYDPWEPLNRRIYIFNAAFDEYVFLPIVRAYEFVLPNFAQAGVSNVFKNLTEVTNLTNALLQFKFRKALNTVCRVVLNTTVGVGGLFDVATTGGKLPRENEDFGQTLGFYGLGTGPYLVLPIFGPSNLRDTAGLAVDSVVYGMMLQQLIAELDMDDTNEEILYWSLTGLAAIDQRHLQPFRYYMTGSPFEYTLVRKLSTVRRGFLVEH